VEEIVRRAAGIVRMVVVIGSCRLVAHEELDQIELDGQGGHVDGGQEDRMAPILQHRLGRG
jgi:hypothetical protein